MKVATQCRRGTAEEIRGIGQATRDFARNAKVLGKPWFEHSARAAAALNSWKLTVVDNASGLFKSLDITPHFFLICYQTDI